MIQVVIGNPPYNMRCKNNDSHAKMLVEAYKNDPRLSASAKRVLNDDYVEFISFAQREELWRI